MPNSNEIRAVVLVCGLAMCVSFASAQAREPNERQGRSKRPEGLEQAINLALALRAEYAADIALGLVERGAIADRAWRMEILDRVFDQAHSAENPYPRANTGEYNDTAQGRRSAAFMLELDSLSIQCRAISAMARISAPHALDLWGRIVRPERAKLTCQEPLVYGQSRYFPTAALLFQQTFTPPIGGKEEMWNSCGRASGPSIPSRNWRRPQRW